MRALVSCAVLLCAGTASSEPRLVELGEHLGVERISDEGREALAAPDERAKSRLIFLNKDGATVTPGASDARKNRSSMASQTATIPPWAVSDEMWAETVACLHELFAPFDVRFTERDPGDVTHIEAVFGGNASMLGLPKRAGGASPVSTSCRVIENAMVFAFTDDVAPRARAVCEVMAHEIAHSYGLDHVLLPADPMTYLSYAGDRAFQDIASDCGETSARACGVPGYATCRAQQNSYALLLERLGPALGEDGTADDADAASPDEVGCSTRRTSPLTLVLVLGATLLRARRRYGTAAGLRITRMPSI